MANAARPAPLTRTFNNLELAYTPGHDWVVIRASYKDFIHGYVLDVTGSPRLVLSPGTSVTFATLSVLQEFVKTLLEGTTHEQADSSG